MMQASGGHDGSVWAANRAVDEEGNEEDVVAVR